jgi:hypothetical protein
MYHILITFYIIKYSTANASKTSKIKAPKHYGHKKTISFQSKISITSFNSFSSKTKIITKNK